MTEDPASPLPQPPLPEHLAERPQSVKAKVDYKAVERPPKYDGSGNVY